MGRPHWTACAGADDAATVTAPTGQPVPDECLAWEGALLDGCFYGTARDAYRGIVAALHPRLRGDAGLRAAFWAARLANRESGLASAVPFLRERFPEHEWA